MTALVLGKADLEDLASLGDAMVKSGFFGGTDKIVQAMVKVIAGREVGLGPVEAMRAFHTVDGKVSWTADALAGRVKGSARYDYRVLSLDDDGCELEFYEDEVAVGRSAFTDADRRRADLSGPSWHKYPRNMMFARALTNGVGWYCPDVAWSPPIDLAAVAAFDPAAAMPRTYVLEGAAESPAPPILETSYLDEPEPSEPAVVDPTPSEGMDEDDGAAPAGSMTGAASPSLWEVQRLVLISDLEDAAEARGISAFGWLNAQTGKSYKTAEGWDVVDRADLERAVAALREGAPS